MSVNQNNRTPLPLCAFILFHGDDHHKDHDDLDDGNGGHSYDDGGDGDGFYGYDDKNNFEI